MQPTIFQYIKEHLDARGRFTSSVLSDSKLSTPLRPLGAEDAFYYTTDSLEDRDGARAIQKALLPYLAHPCESTQQALYHALDKKIFAEYCDAIINMLDGDSFNDATCIAVSRLFYTATKREQLKLALLLYGFCGMEHIKEQLPELWQDLLMVARCEEFTFAFLYACRLRNFRASEEAWELLHCTTGWGKVFAVLQCSCTSLEQRLWLLENGPVTEVDYPPIAAKLIIETKLVDLLTKKLNYEQYKSAVIIVGGYLLLAGGVPPEKLYQCFNLQAVDLPLLLRRLLAQAERRLRRPEDILDLMGLDSALRSLQNQQRYDQLTPNQCEQLRAECERLIFRHDLLRLIDEELIYEDEVNYAVCDIAYYLEYDIWERLYEYWLQHPQATELFPYLLPYEGEERSERVLRHLETLLPSYRGRAHALVVPLRYLADNPGQGETVLCEALTSMYELQRGLALSALQQWPREQLTPQLLWALCEAKRLTVTPFLQGKIDKLLVGIREGS